MRIAALLPAAPLARLRQAAEPRHALAPVPTWRDLPRVLHTRDVEAAALDPSVEDDGRDAALAALRALPSLPVLLYLPLTPAAVRLALPFSEGRAARLHFTDVDDAADALRASLDGLADDGRAERFLAPLRARLAEGPSAVTAAVEALARAPQRFPDAERLAEAAGTSRRSLDRWLVRSGVGPARRLIVAARVWAAHRLLRDPGLRVEDVVERLGYSDESVLKRHVQDVCGLRPSALRGAPDEAWLLAQVAAYLTRVEEDGEEPEG